MKNIFNSQSRQEKEYIPPVTNRHIGARKTTGEFEDEYTKAKRREDFLASLEENPHEDFFIAEDGRKIPLSELNGQSAQLLKETRDNIAKEIAEDAALKQINENPLEEETPSALRSAVKKEAHKDGWAGVKGSIGIFHDKPYIHHDPDGNHKKIKNGLYKDYNPKLNPGAPGNIKEARRKTRKEQEERNWEDMKYHFKYD